MNRLATAAVLAALSALLVVLFVASVTPDLGLLLFAMLGSFPVEALLYGDRSRWLVAALNRAHFGVTWRVFIRQTLVVVFLVRAHAVSGVALCGIAGAFLAHHLVLGLHGALRAVINSRRLRQVETRNLDVPGEALPPAPPMWLLQDARPLMLVADVVFVAALGWAFVTGSYRLVLGGAVLAVLIAAVLVLALIPQTWALLRLPQDSKRMIAAQEAVLDLRPRVILYFSGNAASVYQVNMWFQTMERLDRRAMVLLRERRYLSDLADTTVPVLCLPFSVDVMNLRIPSARVALYVANVGRNIHLIRDPNLKSAFIGHGDSDKTASFNPITKMYDEVWVAGEAGRQRYARAQVGVRDDEIVLVGRPQLDGIEDTTSRETTAPFTVLYAPTWEGWTDEPFNSSLSSIGAVIVETLLAMPGVRVMYKPHPLTGSVDAAIGHASQDVVAKLIAAQGGHVVVLDNTRSLYECFNESDAMISDISSVVSDYLRSEKPYFVTNAAGVDDDLFRELNPSAGAAYLIGPHAVGLREGMEQARGADVLRGSRREVRTYLLGDPQSEPMSLFRQAVDNLAAQADVRLAAVGPSAGDDDTALMEPLESDALANSGPIEE